MRFKTKWEKLVIATIGISIGVFLVGTGKAEAALQANSATHETSSPKTLAGSKWIVQIRQMEEKNQTMGLSETVNTSTLAGDTDNKIDVHMMKSSEFGAMAILSASGFGNPNKLMDSATTVKSTTGNVTGVYVKGNRWEWVAGVGTGAVSGINPKYYDAYTIGEDTATKVGDLLKECQGWHGGGNTNWFKYNNSAFGYGGRGMFSFDSGGSTFANNSWSSSQHCGRGVAVVGSGL